jgi:uncharacterized protein (TIGR02246 family)
MRLRTSILILAGGLLGILLFMDGTAWSRCRRFFVRQTFVHAVEQAQPEKTAGKDHPAKDAVMANVRAFTQAYNRRDIKSILKLFTEDCILTEADGTTLNGLKELEKELTESFKEDSDSQLSINVESLQVISPDVILEEGKTNFFPDGKTLTAETDYQVTHVKRDGRWLMARARSFNRVVLNPYDSLRELEWLVGDWINEDEDSVVESTYRWDTNKAFLLHDFSIRVQGKKTLTGTQRIGRDPLSKQIKAWVFDSEGGYAESLWSSTDDGWIMRAMGVRSDGKVVTVTNQLTQLTPDRFRFDAADRVAGDERLPNVTIISVRRPPEVKKR